MKYKILISIALLALLAVALSGCHTSAAADDRSKIHPLRDGIRMGLDVLRVRWNALRGRYRRILTAQHG